MVDRNRSVHEWSRQPGEKEAAYHAFLAYRDLGVGRTVSGAYRQIRRKPGAKQADGTWNDWARRFRWAERARAWDDHLQSKKDDSTVKAVETEAEKWARRLVEELESDFVDAQLYKKKANQLAALPVIQQTTTGPGGATTIIEPVGSADLRRAAAVRDIARIMAHEAIRGALPPDRADVPAAADIPADEAAAMRDAQRRVRAEREGRDIPEAPED